MNDTDAQKKCSPILYCVGRFWSTKLRCNSFCGWWIETKTQGSLDSSQRWIHIDWRNSAKRRLYLFRAGTWKAALGSLLARESVEAEGTSLGSHMVVTPTSCTLVYAIAGSRSILPPLKNDLVTKPRQLTISLSKANRGGEGDIPTATFV